MSRPEFKERAISPKMREMARLAKLGKKNPGASEWWKNHNPMHSVESKEKMIATLKEKNHRPKKPGGNGTGMSEAEMALSKKLGEDWISQFVIAMMPPESGKKKYPHPYKFDFGNEKLKVLIEVDGISHKMLARKAQDSHKRRSVELLGWKVLSISNTQAKDISISELQNILATL
jgi:hypothetical protein